MDPKILERAISQSSWSPKYEQILQEPYNYLSSLPGKEIRTKLIEAFNVWLDVPEADLGIIKNVVRMLHTASLLMDDVEDDSQLRRGIPVTHKVFGVPQTINTANYVYFQAFQELFKFRNRSGSDSTKPELEEPRARRPNRQGVYLDEVITEELINLHRGQGLDLFWRDSLTCPTEEEYMQMVLGKTGGLFRIAVKLMMARSASDVDFVPLVNLISILFQIRDDYMNLASTEYGDNKGFCEDLTEGKFSFPVVHAIRASKTDRQILNILQKRTQDHALKVHAVQIMQERTGSFRYTRQVMSQLQEQVRKEIARLGGNELLEKIVGSLEVSLEEGDKST
ncbi:hypothetical protein NliqN6_0678 [Naganishia liquefaciens]|uniref:(2E,6E)-farnesyl diphosphate synthase n=1 Tax=Naganishia liquefaciens TaxID=104408 RepID=A0A8H3TP07_9TREE|nr:hypothetical protein NliqN6_0678 [Naganishia liquefaciens]